MQPERGVYRLLEWHDMRALPGHTMAHYLRHVRQDLPLYLVALLLYLLVGYMQEKDQKAHIQAQKQVHQRMAERARQQLLQQQSRPQILLQLL